MAKDPYLYFRVEARDLLDGLSQGVLALEKDGVGKDVVARLLRMAHTLKGAARVVKQAKISESAHGMEDVLARYRDSEGRLPRDEAGRLLEFIDQCGEQLQALSAPQDKPQDNAVHPAVQAPAEEQIGSVRIEIAQLDSLLREVAEAHVQLDAARQTVSLLEQTRRTARRLVERTANRQNGRGSETSLVTAAAISALAEELGTNVAAASATLRTATEHLERGLGGICERAGELRLLPASVVFASLERTVRDAAESLQKRVALETSGGEQRLDAHILFALRDPLMHAVRNAVAHGIESECDRVAAGKPATGRIAVQVKRIGQRIVFRVEDDGRGLDLAGIRRAAVGRGLATADKAESLGIAELTEILFHGGLSTSPALSEFSGRGVGLDVVRTTARRLKGEASLQSRAGQGTILEVSTPVSIESLTVLAADVDGSTVLFPFGAIRQTVRAAEKDFTHSANGTSIIVEDQVIPFRPLGGILSRESRNGTASRSWSVVLLEAGGARVGVGVDRLKELRSAVVRPLPALCGPVPLIMGATLNGMGNPELVLEPASVVKAVLAHPGPTAPPALPVPPTVLVVDDSLTTRMLEQSILEGAGFRVELATSGEEALVKAKEKPHALFVVDVEMPGMNGFELLHRFRGDPQLQGTPAIMVTSRASADDRRCAAEAGARDYIIKSEFDETRLLRTIRGLMSEIAR